MTVTENHDKFEWGPRRRMSPAGPRSSDSLLLLVVIALLAAAILSLVVHHDPKTKTTNNAAATTGTTSHQNGTTTAPPATTTTTVATPAGYERLLDSADHITLAVPAGWEAPGVTGADLATELKSMAAKDPTLAPLLSGPLAALTQIPLGVFAIDTATHTTLYVFGVVLPGKTSLAQVPGPGVVKQIQGNGGKFVSYTPVALPIGPAGQVSAELIVDKTTTAEAFDYFFSGGRFITMVVSTRGSKAPTTVLHEIAATLGTA